MSEAIAEQYLRKPRRVMPLDLNASPTVVTFFMQPPSLASGGYCRLAPGIFVRCPAKPYYML